MTELSAPFEPREVKFKPQSVTGNRALALAHIDCRVIQDRLDEVLENATERGKDTIEDGTDNWDGHAVNCHIFKDTRHKLGFLDRAVSAPIADLDARGWTGGCCWWRRASSAARRRWSRRRTGPAATTGRWRRASW